MLPYSKEDIRRALALCGIVGTWLVAINQGGELAAGRVSEILYLRIALDYVTPFTVSSLTGLMGNWREYSKSKKQSRLDARSPNIVASAPFPDGESRSKPRENSNEHVFEIGVKP